MQLAVKVDVDAVGSPAQAVREMFARVRPDLAKAASVDEVFPQVRSGRRAGLVIVDVHAELPPKELATLVQSLRACAHVVYVEVAAPRTRRS